MRILLAAIGTLLALTTAAQAANSSSGDLAIYGGAFSVVRDSDKETGMAGIEYRFKDQWNGLRPTIGGFVNADSASYGYAGAYWDLPLNTAPFVISPGFAVGGYHQGASKDLGHGIEFRSTLEVSYKFQNAQRLGVQIAHLSNASLGDSNPGTETLEAVYSHPF
jgi:hypothetical protein